MINTDALASESPLRTADTAAPGVIDAQPTSLTAVDRAGTGIREIGIMLPHKQAANVLRRLRTAMCGTIRCGISPHAGPPILSQADIRFVVSKQQPERCRISQASYAVRQRQDGRNGARRPLIAPQCRRHYWASQGAFCLAIE